jgi:hypothetical protein
MIMLLLFANCQPYVRPSDDSLAQFCQFSLTFTLMVGILEQASTSFQDHLYGSLLIISTTANLLLGFIVIVTDFAATVVPDAADRQASRLLSKPMKLQVARKNVVAPVAAIDSVPRATIHSDTDEIRATTPTAPILEQLVEGDPQHVESSEVTSVAGPPKSSTFERASTVSKLNDW